MKEKYSRAHRGQSGRLGVLWQISADRNKTCVQYSGYH